MDNSTLSIALTGVVPAVCDAEAGVKLRIKPTMYPATGSGSGNGSVSKIRSVMAELCCAIRSALDDERSTAEDTAAATLREIEARFPAGPRLDMRKALLFLGRRDFATAEDSLRRAAEILQELGETPMTSQEEVRGGLSPWQLRKVTRHIEAQLDQPIRNEDLAALVRLNPSHFGRAFRNSCGESPHEYVIRRRVERAQGLMLSTDASLSEIALDCGLADQAHLSRLFRRIVGETPRAWRRARSGAPAECV